MFGNNKLKEKLRDIEEKVKNIDEKFLKQEAKIFELTYPSGRCCTYYVVRRESIDGLSINTYYEYTNSNQIKRVRFSEKKGGYAIVNIGNTDYIYFKDNESGDIETYLLDKAEATASRINLPEADLDVEFKQIN